MRQSGIGEALKREGVQHHAAGEKQAKRQAE
jgi:hypothetical protein